MNPGSIPAATRPTNLTSTPDSLCLRQLIYLISPIKLRARTHTAFRANSDVLHVYRCTSVHIARARTRAVGRTWSTMRDLFRRRSPGGEFVDGYWILALLAQLPPENRSVSGMRFNPLLHTYSLLSRDERREIFFYRIYIKSVPCSIGSIRMLREIRLCIDILCNSSYIISVVSVDFRLDM